MCGVARFEILYQYATIQLHIDTDRFQKKILLRAPLERFWRALVDSMEVR
jgi:hypothetical protein